MGRRPIPHSLLKKRGKTLPKSECEQSDKSKFEDRRWGSIFIAFTPLQKMEDMVKY
jgi:hypothetical protein